ncbi:UNVERIFIED_CONTAM: hypothetical protein GTU68_061139 [Idotea baltica]|nr:hypothetical protein [Idotea baltica]
MKLVKLNHRHNPANYLDRFFNEPVFQDGFFKDAWNRNVAQVNPSVNIVEHKDDFTIELVSPGLTKEDFKINVEKNVMTIKVEQEAEATNEDKKWHRREFSFSSFERSFRLPETIQEDKIGARYEQGILFVTLPKMDEAIEKPARAIDIA